MQRLREARNISNDAVLRLGKTARTYVVCVLQFKYSIHLQTNKKKKTNLKFPVHSTVGQSCVAGRSGNEAQSQNRAGEGNGIEQELHARHSVAGRVAFG